MPYPQYGFGVPQYPTQPVIQPNVQYQQPLQNASYPQQVQPVNTQPIWANKVYVTSLQDALSRFLTPNSSIVYTMQDEKTEIEVSSDAQGKKTYQLYERKPCNSFDEKNATFTEKNNATVSIDEFNATISELKSMINNVPQTDLTGYAKIADIDTLREDFSNILKSEINGLKTKITSLGGKKNAE